MKSMITFQHITLAYPNKEKIFDDFNLTIQQGEKILLKGPSGCGKTTLLKMILGYVRPTQGSIIIDDKELTQSSIHEIRKNLCYISQDVDLPDMTIQTLLDTIYNYQANTTLSPPNQHQLNTLLKTFKLTPQVLSQSTHQLSGGERQRIGIIITQLLNRPIWLLDEITSALDTDLKTQTINNLLGRPNTIIAISHDPQWSKHPNIRTVDLKAHNNGGRP